MNLIKHNFNECFFSCRVGLLLRKQHSIFVKLIKVNGWLGRLDRVKVNLLGIRPTFVLDFEPRTLLVPVYQHITHSL